MQPPHKT